MLPDVFQTSNWRRLSGKPITEPIVQAVERCIMEEQALGNRLKVCIGTDSQVHTTQTEFATVIVFVREKRGGFMLISNESVKAPMSLKERLLLEVSRSIDIAYRLCDTLDKYKVGLEVHADINTNPRFQSSGALHDAMGYILGMGFVFKAKPDAFASSSCADKMV